MIFKAIQTDSGSFELRGFEISKRFSILVAMILMIMGIILLLFGCTSKRPPTITKVEPVMVSDVGGTEISITGTGFKSGLLVTIGGRPVTDVKILTQRQLKAIAPAGIIGHSEIVIQNIKTKLKSLPFKEFNYYKDVVIIACDLDPNGIKPPIQISVTFNQDVEPTQVTMIVTNSYGEKVDGVAVQDSINLRTYRFTPLEPFSTGDYIFTVSGAKGIAAGNVMTNDYTMSFNVKGKAGKNSSISKSDIITQRRYVPGSLSPSNDGYAWQQASEADRMSLCRAYQSSDMLSKFNAMWYYNALNAFYNTSNSSILNMTIAEATGLVYVGGLNSR